MRVSVKGEITAVQKTTINKMHDGGDCELTVTDDVVAVPMMAQSIKQVYEKSRFL